MVQQHGRSIVVSFAGMAAALWACASVAQPPSQTPDTREPKEKLPEPYERTIPVDLGDTPAPLRVSDVDITYGGFIKLDVLYSLFSDGDVPSLSGGRDYFLASTIPVAASPSAEDSHAFLDFHVKDTRFSFKLESHVAGHKLDGLLELDFRSPPGGANEVVTNGFNPRLRRAVVNYDAWTFGQDWTTFRNLDATPDHIDDLAGPSEGTVLVRQPLVRYAWSGFHFALENNEANLQPFGGGAMFVTGDAQLPDLVVRYDLKTGFGAYSVAALVRQLEADGAATGSAAPNHVADGSATAWGVSLSGKAPSFAKDDVRFTVTAGDGVGRYVAVAAIADAVVTSTQELETIPLLSAHVSYRHPWTDRWRSNLSIGVLEADNDATLTGTGATRSVESAHLNVIYTPVDKLLFGLEYMHAIRELETGEDGTLDRLQFSTKYAF
jgi:hypothetical protein